jgi:L-2-hydroxyglutarate oxidase LhgO
MTDPTDVVVVGAGVVGCAIAHVLARSGRDVVVLEREARPGTGVTSRNSGVVHSGIYYPPGSRKARTCIRGNAMLYSWAQRHGVPHRRIEKLVVAREHDDLAAVHELHANALASGAEGTRLVSTAEVRACEPDLPDVAGALLCERSGIIDAHALVRSLVAEAERNGATFVTRANVTALERRGPAYVLESSRGAIETPAVVNAAGLHCDEIAALSGLTTHRIHPCRGDYFRLRTAAAYRRLVYPVRRPGQVGLGVHLTIDLAGSYVLGPDTQYVDTKDDFGPAEHKRAAFAAAAARLLGPVSEDQLFYDSCGLRPKLRAPHETEDRDFEIVEHPPGVVHLLGIESPGLTAALALADEVATRLGVD